MKKENKERKIEQNKKGKEEKCVVCGANTGYTFDISIFERQFYIEGAGQLCPKCHDEIYGKKKEE